MTLNKGLDKPTGVKAKVLHLTTNYLCTEGRERVSETPFGIDQNNGDTLNAETPIMSTASRPDLGTLEGTPLSELILKLGKDSSVLPS